MRRAATPTLLRKCETQRVVIGARLLFKVSNTTTARFPGPETIGHWPGYSLHRARPRRGEANKWSPPRLAPEPCLRSLGSWLVLRVRRPAGRSSSRKSWGVR